MDSFVGAARQRAADSHGGSMHPAHLCTRTSAMESSFLSAVAERATDARTTTCHAADPAPQTPTIMHTPPPRAALAGSSASPKYRRRVLETLAARLSITREYASLTRRDLYAMDDFSVGYWLEALEALAPAPQHRGGAWQLSVDADDWLPVRCPHDGSLTPARSASEVKTGNQKRQPALVLDVVANPSALRGLDMLLGQAAGSIIVPGTFLCWGSDKDDDATCREAHAYMASKYRSEGLMVG